ncbi:MAG: cysteine desulfurase, partial [Ruminococcus sp.]|nr:cysteine desulfurase [Ruminococcus sp.]
YVSSGSACSKGAQSGVLAQFGVNQKDSDSALRVSISCDTTEEELELFAEKLREGIENIRT